MRLTTGCTAFGHPELELETGALPEPLVDFVVRFIETRVAEGGRFEVGQHAQLGSGVLRVAAAGEHLTFTERIPGTDEWVRSVAGTTMAMYRQRCAVESVGLLDRLDFPPPAARALVCKRAAEASEVGFVRQQAGGKELSGWAVLCGDTTHDHDDPQELLATFVENLAVRVQYFELFLAMPVGSLIIKDPDGVAALMFEGKPLAVVPGSFLDKLRVQAGWSL